MQRKGMELGLVSGGLLWGMVVKEWRMAAGREETRNTEKLRLASSPSKESEHGLGKRVTRMLPRGQDLLWVCLHGCLYTQ